MGTFHLEIHDWETDPSAKLAEIARADPQAAHLAQLGYRFAADAFRENLPVAVSGGALPLADGGVSMVVSVSAYQGPRSELSYRENVMELMRRGPDASALCTRPQPGGGKCTKPYAHTDACHPIGG